VGGLSARMRRLQNGFVRTYALTMLAGVVVVLGALAVAR
jgi:NADH-quinone oxidoreductase subunit L